MEPNKPISIGLQSIRKTQESWFADTTVLYNTYTSIIGNIEVSASGDLAYARGTSRLNRNMSNGSIQEVDNWIDIWKKIDGEWKVIVNIWNIENPMEGK
jgi:ketosteroid isomerase-like protein